MAEQVQRQRKTVRRIDECAAEFEAQQHTDRMRKAHRAARKARKLTTEAESFLNRTR